MHSATLLFPLAALVLRTTTAATIPPRQNDPHIVDFRTYGAPGCFAENQGVYTYEQSDLDVCRTFVDATIGSIFAGDIVDGCSREFSYNICIAPPPLAAEGLGGHEEKEPVVADSTGK